MRDDLYRWPLTPVKTELSRAGSSLSEVEVRVQKMRRGSKKLESKQEKKKNM